MTYILDDNDRVAVSRRPLTLTVSGRGAHGILPEGTVRLAAVQDDVGVPHARIPRPSTLKLSRVDGPTVVRVVPGQGERKFPQGTVLDLTLRTEGSRAGDEELVVVRDVEVSGLVLRDLLIVDVVDDSRLSVTAVDAVTDAPIGPLSEAARTAARDRLGVERATSAHDLLVAIDMSSSMAPRFDDGTVTAIVDVVVGLSHVIGHQRRLDVALLGQRVVPVQTDEPSGLAEATGRAIRDVGLGCGFRSMVRTPSTGAGTIVFAVTDAVPVDVRAIRAARERGENRCLVLTGAGRASPARGGVPTTRLDPPPDGTPASGHLLRSPGVLADLVVSLLTAAGTVPA